MRRRYADRLKGKMPVLLLTNDVASRAKGAQEGLTALSEGWRGPRPAALLVFLLCFQRGGGSPRAASSVCVPACSRTACTAGVMQYVRRYRPGETALLDMVASAATGRQDGEEEDEDIEQHGEAQAPGKGSATAAGVSAASSAAAAAITGACAGILHLLGQARRG